MKRPSDAEMVLARKYAELWAEDDRAPLFVAMSRALLHLMDRERLLDDVADAARNDPNASEQVNDAVGALAAFDAESEVPRG